MLRLTHVTRLVMAVALLVIGGIGSLGAGSLAIPAWRAAHGQGRVGTFTLTEPLSCDRYAPPRQRCGWFGDFVSADGAVTLHRRELSGGLPPGAAVGDTLPARDAGSWTQVYQLSDSQTWKTSAGFSALSAGFFVLGVVLLHPWRLVRRRRGRR